MLLLLISWFNYTSSLDTFSVRNLWGL